MKKIGILTINDFNNFGNRLQNYALQEFLKEQGFEVETIKNIEFINKNRNFIYNIIKFLLYRGTYSQNCKRKKCFKEFNSYINFSKKIIFPKSKLNYDFVFVGSDQVWNPNFGRLSYIDLLGPIEPNKRIAFSASFGISKLPDELKTEVTEQLKKFKLISVREDSGKKIVEELTKRNDIEVLVDPTMLLSENDWSKIAIRPKTMPIKKYIFCYFLGDVNISLKNEINDLAKKYDLDIVDVSNSNSSYYEIGPSEFVFLEKNAEFICTDSFHSCVFATIFKKNFCVFDRSDKLHKDMNSRIDTLLKKFSLEKCKYNKNLNNNYNQEINYNYCIQKLQMEKEKSKKFIEKLI